MRPEKAAVFACALDIIAKTKGKEAALRFVDIWIDDLKKEDGREDAELKQAAYEFVNGVAETTTTATAAAAAAAGAAPVRAPLTTRKHMESGC